MAKTSVNTGKSRMKFQEKPDKKSVSVKSLDPIVSGALLGILAVLALLLLKDKTSDAGELLVLGRYIKEDLGSDQSFNWTGRSALIAGLLPGAVLWSICKKKFSLSFGSGRDENKFTGVILDILRGIAGGALIMAGIQLSGFSVWAALQKAIQLSGRAALFLITAAVTAFIITAAAGVIRRKGK